MSPLHTTEEATTVVEDEMHDFEFSNRRCCCWIPYRSVNFRSTWWERIENDDDNSSCSKTKSHGQRWWTRGWNKVREWSEIVGGPKWKAFIRRFNKKRTSKGGRKFYYDPLSYARNFDDGPGQNGDLDEDHLRINFSNRYASALPVLRNPPLT